MYTLSEIAKKILNSRIEHCSNPDNVIIRCLATHHQNLPESLTYVSDKTYLKSAIDSPATAVMIHPDWVAQFNRPVIVVPDVDMALIEILNLFYPSKKPSGKIKQNAVIDPTAVIGENTDIGNFVTIGANSRIGKNSIIGDGVKIGNNVIIGDEARIGPNCVFFEDVKIGNRFTVFSNTSIGGDGFRFIDRKGIQYKIPQVGGVTIGDDVEIGSNTSIDRGGIDDTMIGSGTKIDNDVQIAHNVKIGTNVIVAGATAIAGSAIVGDGCKISGSCAVADHITLPPGTMIAGGSGLRNTPEKADLYAGWDWNLNFREFQKFRANVKHILSLNLIVKRIKDIEEKLGIKKD